MNEERKGKGIGERREPTLPVLAVLFLAMFVVVVEALAGSSFDVLMLFLEVSFRGKDISGLGSCIFRGHQC